MLLFVFIDDDYGKTGVRIIGQGNYRHRIAKIFCATLGETKKWIRWIHRKNETFLV
jgi:hypothetical protein